MEARLEKHEWQEHENFNKGYSREALARALRALAGRFEEGSRLAWYPKATRAGKVETLTYDDNTKGFNDF